MTGGLRLFGVLVIVVACLAGQACQLPRPETTPVRMVEPQLIEPAAPISSAASAVSVRLLETQARGHLGLRVLHQHPDGELTEDGVWRWSSTPDRYLDTALRLEVASRANLRLVDTLAATSLAVTLLAWHLESAGSPRLAGAIEVQLTGIDRVIRTEVIRASEPVSATLPGDLAAASGRLFHRLAGEALARVPR